MFFCLVSNLDLRGYRVRYTSGSTGEWADMTSLHSGNLAGSPWETGSITATGDHRFGLVSVDTSGNESAPVYFNLTLETTGETDTPPGAPSGLAATAMYLSVFLEWTNPTSNFSETEVWISDTNDRTAATLLASTVAPIFQIEREDGDTAYIWIRSNNSAGTPGPFNTGETAGTSIAALTTIDSTSAAAITATAAKIATLYAANIAAGEIASGTVIIGSGGSIRSHDYEPGTQGWKLDGAGAELVSAIIRGTISSGGSIQSSNFQTGVQGFQLDGDGNAEFNTVTIYGEPPRPEVYVGSTEIGTGDVFSSYESITLDVTVPAGCSSYYTTDGSTPTETDTEVPSNSEITVSSSKTVKIRSFEDGTGRSGSVWVADLKINYLNPVKGRSPDDDDLMYARSYKKTSYVAFGESNSRGTLPTSWSYKAMGTFSDSSGNSDGYVAGPFSPTSLSNKWVCHTNGSNVSADRVGDFVCRGAVGGGVTSWDDGDGAYLVDGDANDVEFINVAGDVDDY